MIQALPPPPPPYQCVKAADVAKAKVEFRLTVTGDPDQLGAWLKGLPPLWKVLADAQSNDIRFVRLSVPSTLPYREIGGLIYNAQLRRLDVSSSTVPPICESEEQ